MSRRTPSSYPATFLFPLFFLLLCAGCSRGVSPTPLELMPLAVPERHIIAQVRHKSIGSLATQAADDGLDWSNARLKLTMQNSVYANGQVAVRPKGTRLAIQYPFTWCKVATSNHVCSQKDKVIVGTNVMVFSVRKQGNLRTVKVSNTRTRITMIAEIDGSKTGESAIRYIRRGVWQGGHSFSAMHTIKSTTFEFIPSKNILRTYSISTSRAGAQFEDMDIAMLTSDTGEPHYCSHSNSISPDCGSRPPPPTCSNCDNERREVRDAERWVAQEAQDVREATQDVEDVKGDRRAKRIQVGLGVGGLITACPADLATGILTPGEFACVVSVAVVFDGTESLENSQATLQREERDLARAQSDLAAAERRLADAREALDRCRRNC